MAPEENDVVHVPVKTKVFVYISHCFTTLGARMWWFGIGLFLVEVTPQSLQLTALYGFSNGGAMLLLAAVIGDWIDRSGRLKAARVALVLNNLSITVCCVVIFLVLTYRSEIEAIWSDSRLLTLCFAVVVIITIFSNLCNLGRVIIMERDWIVEICKRDTDTIATMSATFRFIDLCTKVVAPLVTGQVMTYASHIYGAVFIGCWNLFALLIEYYLVWKVYSLVPALHYKTMDRTKDYPDDDAETNKITLEPMKNQEHADKHSVIQAPNFTSNEDRPSDSSQTKPFTNERKSSLNDPGLTPSVCYQPSDAHSVNQKLENGGSSTSINMKVSKDGRNDKQKGCAETLCFSMVSLFRGWRYYMKYDVAVAGWSLAFLYFTVLGFDNITIGYATTQGMTESMVGILIGCAALFGILASVSYPFIRRKVGLVRAGTIGLSWEVSCLCLCIISLWMPGGTFDPHREWHPTGTFGRNCSSNVSQPSSFNLTDGLNLFDPCNGTIFVEDQIPKSKASIVMLMMGIVGARFGVWLTDLVITQLFLESVAETERGIVNGFQSSLNKLMDMLKFVMIIFIPDPSMFGYPAVVSFCFIFSAWLLYSRFSKKRTGHMFCGTN